MSCCIGCPEMPSWQFVHSKRMRGAGSEHKLFVRYKKHIKQTEKLPSGLWHESLICNIFDFILKSDENFHF